MVYIDNKEQFREALKFAKTLPKESRKSFQHCISTLNRLKRNGYKDMDLHIYPDWVKHSFGFGFGIVDDLGRVQERGLNGGMILHGFQETFSVSLTSNNYPYLSIHT